MNARQSADAHIFRPRSDGAILAYIARHAYEGGLVGDVRAAVDGAPGAYQAGLSVDYQPFGLTSYG